MAPKGTWVSLSIEDPQVWLSKLIRIKGDTKLSFVVLVAFQLLIISLCVTLGLDVAMQNTDTEDGVGLGGCCRKDERLELRGMLLNTLILRWPPRVLLVGIKDTKYIPGTGGVETPAFYEGSSCPLPVFHFPVQSRPVHLVF